MVDSLNSNDPLITDRREEVLLDENMHAKTKERVKKQIICLVWIRSVKSNGQDMLHCLPQKTQKIG